VTFDLTPDALAGELTPYLGKRPTIVAVERGVVITDPLPLAVVIVPASVPDHFDVQCYQRLEGIAVGIAFLAANDVSFGSSSGVRARVFPSGGHLVALIENGVCGPILPGQDFAVAIRTVLDGIEAFQRSAARFLDIQEAMGRVAELSGSAAPSGTAAPPAPAPAVLRADPPAHADDSRVEPNEAHESDEVESASGFVADAREASARRFQAPGYL